MLCNGMHLLVFQYLMMAPQEIWWAWQELFLWATEVMDVSLLSKKRFSNKLITLYIFLKISSIIKWSFFFFFLLLFIMSTRLLFFLSDVVTLTYWINCTFFFPFYTIISGQMPNLNFLTLWMWTENSFLNLAWISDFVIFFKMCIWCTKIHKLCFT